MKVENSTVDAVAERLGLIGQGRLFLEMLASLHAEAASESLLLLHGEPGLDFRRCAQFVHLCSTRADKEFVPLDCTAPTDMLFERELFAHSSGQHTDQRVRPAGLLRDGNGGTLYLNDIRSLPQPAMVKLRRLLQAGDYRRIGGPNVHSSSLRLVVSVIRERGTKARLDNVFDGAEKMIRLPALCERREDIPILLEHYAEQYAHESSCGTVVQFECPAVEWLRDYPWPGNDRELEEFVRKLTVRKGPRRVSVEMLRGILPPATSSSCTTVPTAANGVTTNRAETQGGTSGSESNAPKQESDSLAQSGDPGPSEVEQRRYVASRRWHLLIFIIFFVTILLSVLLGYASRGWLSPPVAEDPQKESDHEVSETAEELDQIFKLTEDYQFDDARQLLDTIDIRVEGSSAESRVRKLRQRLDRVESNEQRRRSELAQLTTDLEQSLPTLDETTLSAARRLARTEDEWQQLNNINRQGLKLIESSRRSDFARLAADLQQSSPDLDETTMSAARRLVRTEDEWQQLRDIGNHARQHAALLVSVSVAVGDTGAFEAALKRYAMVYANTTRAKDFEKVLQDVGEVLKSVEQWNALIDNHSPQIMRSLDPMKASDLQEQANVLLPTCDGLPGSKYVRDFVLTHARARDRRGMRHLQSVVRLLNERWVRAPFDYEWTDGSRYYLAHEPPNIGQRVVCTYFSDLKSTEKRIQLSTAGFTQRLTNRSASIASLDSIIDSLHQMDPASWESVFIDIMSRVRSDNGLGSASQVYLLREIARLACEGSPAFRVGFDRVLAALEEVEFAADGTWLDPLSERSKTARKSSEEALSLLDQAHAQCVVTTWQAMLDDASQMVERLLWCGWLRRENGTWKCERPRGSTPSGSTGVYVILRRSSNEPLRLIEIGRIDEIGVRPVLVEGLPVFSIAKRWGQPRPEYGGGGGDPG